MTDKIQKIREEVVRMHNLLPVMDGDNISINYADRICTTLEMYIDSLQKEPVSEDLDEAADEYAPDFSNSIASKAAVNAVRYAFKAGAKWQKEQLMIKAIDAHVNYAWSGLCFGGFDWSKTGLDMGDKCKLIIIKED